MPKIIFLDIDGPLNSKRTFLAFGSRPLKIQDLVRLCDPVAIGLVRRLCAISGAQIVLSSSWRYEYPFQEIAEALQLPIIDTTPYGQTRSIEISGWLEDHPEVVEFAIIDDIAMPPKLLANAVTIDDDNGITYEDYRKLCQILKVSPYDKVVAQPTVAASPAQ